MSRKRDLIDKLRKENARLLKDNKQLYFELMRLLRLQHTSLANVKEMVVVMEEVQEAEKRDLISTWVYYNSVGEDDG